MGNQTSSEERARKSSVRAITKCIKNDPSNALLYLVRAELMLDRAKYAEAVTDYTKCIELDSSQLKAYDERALCYNMLGQYDYAICDLSKRIEIEPQNAKAYNNRGAMFRAKGDYASAIIDLTKAIAIDPCDPYSYRNRAAAYCGNDQIKRAKGDLLKAIELDPKGDAMDYAILGDLALYDKDEEAAIDYYTKALELDPSNEEVDEKLADLLGSDSSCDEGEGEGEGNAAVLEGIAEVQSEDEADEGQDGVEKERDLHAKQQVTLVHHDTHNPSRSRTTSGSREVKQSLQGELDLSTDTVEANQAHEIASESKESSAADPSPTHPHRNSNPHRHHHHHHHHHHHGKEDGTRVAPERISSDLKRVAQQYQHLLPHQMYAPHLSPDDVLSDGSLGATSEEQMFSSRSATDEN